MPDSVQLRPLKCFKQMTSVRTAVQQIYHTDQTTYCDNMRTICKLLFDVWLVPVLRIPRSCSIVSVPDFSSLPLWCILWYMVLRKYCTHDSQLCYIFCFISLDGDLFSNLWSTHWRLHTVYDQITCMCCEFWLCCHQCTWWLCCKSSMYSAEVN